MGHVIDQRHAKSRCHGRHNHLKRYTSVAMDTGMDVQPWRYTSSTKRLRLVEAASSSFFCSAGVCRENAFNSDAIYMYI